MRHKLTLQINSKQTDQPAQTTVVTKLAKASRLRASADQIRGTNHEAFIGYVREAAGFFESIRKFESAASCYCDLGEFERVGCVDHLLSLEEESGHFLEATELVRSRGDVIKEADLLGKAGHNKEAVVLLLWCSLWGYGKKGGWVLGKLGIIDHDPFMWETAKKALTPLFVAVADVLFRKQAVPAKFMFLSLVVILGGAVGCVATDSGFSLTAYSWAFAYLITITTEMVYIKHVVMNLGLNTYFRFACWKAISVTAYTVTGVVNKFLTVAINVLIWDKHASPFGVFCLLVTIAGGILYQQSVTGVGSQTSQHDPAASKLMDNTDDVDDYSEEDEEKGISGKLSGV
nr:hypothetical protein [Tanacetum cinerariifolium]